MSGRLTYQFVYINFSAAKRRRGKRGPSPMATGAHGEYRKIGSAQQRVGMLSPKVLSVLLVWFLISLNVG